MEMPRWVSRSLESETFCDSANFHNVTYLYTFDKLDGAESAPQRFPSGYGVCVAARRNLAESSTLLQNT
eukprot:1325924-Pleurochrysis_carterae.AAC.3